MAHSDNLYSRNLAYVSEEVIQLGNLDLLKWVQQILSGLIFLGTKNVEDLIQF